MKTFIETIIRIIIIVVLIFIALSLAHIEARQDDLVTIIEKYEYEANFTK